MEFFQPWHIIIVVGIAVLIFGGKKLPELGKGLGEGFKGFKDGLKGVTDEIPKPTEVSHGITPKPDTPVEPLK